MTRLLAALDQPDQPTSALTLNREDDFWLIGYADARARVPDSLGLHYLDLLVRHPGRDLAALDLVRLAAATGPAAASAPDDGLHDASEAPAEPILDQQARTAYRQRLTDLDEELAEAEQWHDTERASRLRAEKDFLVRELAAATGLGGRPRQLGSDSERARLNVTRAIRSAIARIRDRAPAAADSSRPGRPDRHPLLLLPAGPAGLSQRPAHRMTSGPAACTAGRRARPTAVPSRAACVTAS